MLKCSPSVTTIQFAITFDFEVSGRLVGAYGLLPRQPESQALSLHPSILPSRQEFLQLFHRLKAIHAPLKALDIDLKGRLGNEPSANIHQVLEFHVREHTLDTASDCGLLPCQADPSSQIFYCDTYGDFSAQAALGLAEDMPDFEDSADGSDPPGYGGYPSP